MGVLNSIVNPSWESISHGRTSSVLMVAPLWEWRPPYLASREVCIADTSPSLMGGLSMSSHESVDCGCHIMGGEGGWEWRPPYLAVRECAVQSADDGLTARSQQTGAATTFYSTPAPLHQLSHLEGTRRDLGQPQTSKQPRTQEAEERGSRSAARVNCCRTTFYSRLALDRPAAVCVGIHRSLQPHLVKKFEPR